jgi:hypothetical protein
MRVEPADRRERGGSACGNVLPSRGIRIRDEKKGGDASNLIAQIDDGKSVGTRDNAASNFRVC